MGKNLLGETAIVTGGGCGFGEKMSHALAREGANTVVADINFKEAERTANSIISENGRAFAVEVDVSKENQVADMVKQVISEYGMIDILINNAGIAGPLGELHSIKSDEWDKVFNVNVRGAFLCSKEVLPHMIKQHKGHIVNISSSTARIGFKHVRSLPYTCSKFTIEGFSYCLSLEMEKHGIRVNALCPSLADTDFQKGTPPEHLRGKRCWVPEHTVGPLLYILTEMEGTGQSIMATTWHEDRKTAEKFSYIHD